MNVVFHPTASVTVTGALSVSTTVSNTPLANSVALNGTGTGNALPQISVEPATLAFGNKGPDTVDSTRTVTLTNTSHSLSAGIQSVSLAGSPNAVGAFPLYKINSNTCGGLLAPGSHCSIQVAFNTTFSEVFPLSYPAAITITGTDPTSPRVIGISGRQAEQLTFSPASLCSRRSP